MAEETQAERIAPTSPKSRMTFKNNKEFIHKPVIRDILRTDICISGSVMLVEKIEIIEASVSNPSAIRLFLGDGELCIQAFLNPHMRRLLEDGEITMGCFVRLDEFGIERVDIERHDDDVQLLKDAKPTKRKRRQQMVFLKIDKLDAVGWDFAYMEHARPALDTTSSNGNPRNQPTPHFDEDDEIEATEVSYTSTKGVRTRSLSGSVSMEGSTMQTDSFGQSTHSDLSQSLDTSKYKTDRGPNHPVEEIRRYQEDVLDQARESFEEPSAKRRFVQEPDVSDLQKPSKASQGLNISSQKSDHLPMATNPHPEAPKEVKQIPVPSPNQTLLVPRTLASLSKLPSRQNSPCTVFAIIDEIAPVKPCPIPPHRTREVRLVDPSTTKRVLLSVLWQPENFTPEIGTPVLLRGLKNHRYDGGSLNAYPKSVSPFTQNADGSDWWIPFPRGWDGCDVDGYLQWWKQRRKGENLST